MTTSPSSFRQWISTYFDTTTQVFLALGLAAAIAIIILEGFDPIPGLINDSVRLMLMILPMIAGGLYVASLVQLLVPRETISRWLGEQSSWGGLVLACFAGIITPGGPFASFALVVGIRKAGADIGTTVTYLTAWALLGVHRIVVWEIPFLGESLTFLRVLVSIPLPFIAGLIARAIAPWFAQSDPYADQSPESPVERSAGTSTEKKR